MDSMVKEGLFNRVMLLDEMHGDNVVSLVDDCEPFWPIVLSEFEGEGDNEDEHKSSHIIESDIHLYTEDGKDVSVVDIRPFCIEALGKIRLLEGKFRDESDDVISLAGDFGPFEPFLQSESEGEMDGVTKHKIGYEVQQLALKTKHEKGVGDVDMPDSKPPSMAVVNYSGNARRTDYEVQCQLAPHSERGKGAGVACVPSYMGTVKSRKEIQNGSCSKFKSNYKLHQTHALPLHLRMADHRVPYTELLCGDSLSTMRYGNLKAVVTKPSKWKARASKNV